MFNRRESTKSEYLEVHKAELKFRDESQRMLPFGIEPLRELYLTIQQAERFLAGSIAEPSEHDDQQAPRYI